MTREYPFKWTLVRPTASNIPTTGVISSGRLKIPYFLTRYSGLASLIAKWEAFVVAFLSCRLIPSYHSSLIFVYPYKELDCQGETTAQSGHSTTVSHGRSSFTDIDRGMVDVLSDMRQLTERLSGIRKHRNHCCFREFDDSSVRAFLVSGIMLVSPIRSIIVWDYKRWVIATLSVLFVGQWVLVFVGT